MVYPKRLDEYYFREGYGSLWQYQMRKDKDIYAFDVCWVDPSIGGVAVTLPYVTKVKAYTLPLHGKHYSDPSFFRFEIHVTGADAFERFTAYLDEHCLGDVWGKAIDEAFEAVKW